MYDFSFDAHVISDAFLIYWSLVSYYNSFTFCACILRPHFAHAGSPAIVDDSPEDIVEHMEEVEHCGGEQVSTRGGI